jgi:hypothetical protein
MNVLILITCSHMFSQIWGHLDLYIFAHVGMSIFAHFWQAKRYIPT